MNENNEYILDFVIPAGPTGPTGPQGLQGIQGPTGPIGASVGLNSYGGKYNYDRQILELEPGIDKQITISNGMYNLNVTFTPANSITLKYFGIYEVNFYCNISVDKEADVTLAVRTNGNKMPACTITKHLIAGIDSTLGGSVVVVLQENAAIDMVISASEAVNVTFAPNMNASFSVKKLNG